MIFVLPFGVIKNNNLTLSVCPRDNSYSSARILMKFSAAVECMTSSSCLDFDDDPNHDPTPRIFSELFTTAGCTVLCGISCLGLLSLSASSYNHFTPCQTENYLLRFGSIRPNTKFYE